MEQIVEQINSKLNPIEGVMERLGVGRSTVFNLIASGELRSVKIGRRRMVSDQAINELIAKLEAGAA